MFLRKRLISPARMRDVFPSPKRRREVIDRSLALPVGWHAHACVSMFVVQRFNMATQAWPCHPKRVYATRHGLVESKLTEHQGKSVLP